jgi:hypothetical protein
MHATLEALNPLFEAVGLSIAALIAGWFSLLSIILSKEKAISEFRQKWINGLRSEISALIAHAMQIQGYIVLTKPFPKNGPPSQEDKDQLANFLEKTRDDHIGLNRASKLVKLRLNPRDPEPESGEILEHLKELNRLFDAPRNPEFATQVDPITEQIADSAQRLLKKEWERVKQGEKTFRNAKRASFAIVALIILAMFLTFAFYGGAVYGSSGARTEQPCAPVPVAK